MARFTRSAAGLCPTRHIFASLAVSDANLRLPLLCSSQPARKIWTVLLSGRAVFPRRRVLREVVVNNDFFRRSASRRHEPSILALHRSSGLLNIGRQLFSEPIHVGKVVA